MAFSTNEQAGSASGPLPVIFRHWIHSREEDTGNLEIFRPEGFAFPPSFGRDGFEIRKDGRFVQDDIGPADGMVLGHWAAVGPERVSVSFDGAGREGYSFEIVAVDESVLRIRRGAQQGNSQTTSSDQ